MDVQSTVNHAAQTFGLQDIQLTKLAMLAAGLFLAYRAIATTYRTGRNLVTGTTSLIAKQKFALRNIVAGGQLIAGLGLVSYGIGEAISWSHLPAGVETAKHFLDFHSHSVARATTAMGAGVGSAIVAFCTCDSETSKQA